MEIEREKLRILYKFGAFVHQDPVMTFVIGLLAGMVKRVHLVRRLEGAPIAIELAAGRARVWPGPALRARVRGVVMPDPLSLASALSLSDDPICVKIRNEAVEQDEVFHALLVEDYAEVVAGRVAAVKVREQRAVELRARIDRALDVYNECMRLMREGDQQRQEELQAYLRIAQDELKTCGRELRELEQELEKAQDGRPNPS